MNENSIFFTASIQNLSEKEILLSEHRFDLVVSPEAIKAISIATQDFKLHSGLNLNHAVEFLNSFNVIKSHRK